MASSDEQEIIQSTVREFSQNELKPLASKIDSEAMIPIELLQKLASLGMFGILCSQQYGGVGASFETMMRVVSELGQASASVALTCLNHNLACSILNEFGSEQQKNLLPELAAGKKFGAVTVPENLSSISAKTSCTLHDNEYILNGIKRYVVNGSFADVCITTCNSEGKTEFLIVEKDIEGFVQGKQVGLLGVRASGITHVQFHHAKTPKNRTIGTKEDTPKILQLLQDGIWLGLSSIALGITRASLDAAVKYANQRIQFGKPIAKFEAIQEMIANISNDMQSTSALLDRIFEMKNQGKNVLVDCASAKLITTTAATKSAKLALKIHGGYGFIRDYSVERFVRDAKAIEILGGRNSDLRMITAREVLG
jgi:butyryl-CoA dehydrogenase